MHKHGKTTPIDRLDRLLDRERRALLAGDLDAVANILQEKETLLTELPPLLDGVKLPDLSGLRSKLVRNQALIEHALAGVRDVAERMKLLRRVNKTLETYDSQGRRSLAYTPAAHRIEKSA